MLSHVVRLSYRVLSLFPISVLSDVVYRWSHRTSATKISVVALPQPKLKLRLLNMFFWGGKDDCVYRVRFIPVWQNDPQSVHSVRLNSISTPAVCYLPSASQPLWVRGPTGLPHWPYSPELHLPHWQAVLQPYGFNVGLSRLQWITLKQVSKRISSRLEGRRDHWHSVSDMVCYPYSDNPLTFQFPLKFGHNLILYIFRH